MCPRFLEPSFTSPIPARLPPIESTIKDMYVIQDRVHHLAEVMDPESLPIRDDVLFCRSYGDKKLCDGFICADGSHCSSGCCGTFGSLQHDHCEPAIHDFCPLPGFTYGPNGNNHSAVPDAVEDPIEDLESFPTPPEFNEDGTGSKPPSEQKKENAFWNGVIVGVIIWAGIIIGLLGLYFCCKKSTSAAGAASVGDMSNYQDLPASSPQHA